MTEYNDHELILRIPTQSPQASHSHLIKALVATVRWFAHAEVTNFDADNIYYLAEFLEQVTPSEKQLH